MSVAQIDELKNYLEKLQVENLALKEIVDEFEMLRNDSWGIMGWHQNGDIAGWEEFEVDNLLSFYYRAYKPEDCI